MSQPFDDTLPRPFGLIASSRTIATDSKGNAWVNNFETNVVTFIHGRTFKATDYEIDERSRGWGLAVDGSDVVWAASFTNPPKDGLLMDPPYMSVVQGARRGRGDLLYSFSNPSLQHITALQIDPSGNVWVANNWSLETAIDPLDIVGGDGVVEFIGVATPVKTPLIGTPENPAGRKAGRTHHDDGGGAFVSVPKQLRHRDSFSSRHAARDEYFRAMGHQSRKHEPQNGSSGTDSKPNYDDKHGRLHRVADSIHKRMRNLDEVFADLDVLSWNRFDLSDSF